MQNKEQLGKIIRRTVVVGVILLTLASTLVVGNTLKVIIFGPGEMPPPEMIAVMEPGATLSPARSDRSPASIGRSRPRVPAYANAGPGSYSPREDGVPGGGGFLESLFGSPQESAFSAAESRGGSAGAVNDSSPKDVPAFPQAQNLGTFVSAGGVSSGSGSSSLSSGNTDSGGTGDSSAGGESNPAVSPQYKNGYTNPNGGIQTVTGGGYYFSASGAVGISGIHGTTPSGRHLWVNESAQVSP